MFTVICICPNPAACHALFWAQAVRASPMADEAGIFRERDDAPAKAALIRMIPAHQRLNSEYCSAPYIYLRLIVQQQFTGFYRLSQLALQSESFKGNSVHGLGIELKIVPALILCMIHCRIGIFQQCINIIPVIGVNGYPYA
jgi:hypothetical protein